MSQEYSVQDESHKFALEIIGLYKFLCDKHEFVLSKQILRSGTSIGANIAEAQFAQSKKDFISKMSIAAKEARETIYWMSLLKESGYTNGFANIEPMKQQLESMLRVLGKILITSKQ